LKYVPLYGIIPIVRETERMVYMKGMNSYEIQWVKELLAEIEQLKSQVSQLQAELAQKEK